MIFCSFRQLHYVGPGEVGVVYDFFSLGVRTKEKRE